MHILHKWKYVGYGRRTCETCKRQQGFWMERGKWTDLGFLETSNADNCYWTRHMLDNLQDYLLPEPKPPRKREQLISDSHPLFCCCDACYCGY